MSKLTFKPTRPITNYFAAVTSNGNIWVDTIAWRQRDAKCLCGKLMEGMKAPDGTTIDNHVDGWAMALARGFRIEKVNIYPVRSALGEQPEVKE